MDPIKGKLGELEGEKFQTSRSSLGSFNVRRHPTENAHLGNGQRKVFKEGKVQSRLRDVLERDSGGGQDLLSGVKLEQTRMAASISMEEGSTARNKKRPGSGGEWFTGLNVNGE